MVLGCFRVEGLKGFEVFMVLGGKSPQRSVSTSPSLTFSIFDLFHLFSISRIPLTPILSPCVMRQNAAELLPHTPHRAPPAPQGRNGGSGVELGGKNEGSPETSALPAGVPEERAPLRDEDGEDCGAASWHDENERV